MFRKHAVKLVAYIVVVAYLSVFNAGTLLARDWKASPETLQFLAQASKQAETENMTPEQAQAMGQIYTEKIQRLESETNKAKGTRNTLLTVAVSSFAIGTGIMVGSTTIKNAVNDIPAKTDQDRKDREDSLKALDAIKGVGVGIIGAGGLSLVGYLIYTASIGSKQKRVDNLRAKLDTQYEAKGLTPEYLQKNESVAAVLQEIDTAKKSAESARTMQSFFSRFAIGSLLCGGFLYTLSAAGRDVVKKINVTTDEQIDSQKSALDQTDKLKTTGFILLGVGAASGITSFLFGQRAKGKENKVDSLENSLLQIAQRIEIRPQRNGFMVMYTHEF
jgi:hypothetical protein